MTDIPDVRTKTLLWVWNHEWRVFRAYTATHCFEVAVVACGCTYRAFLGDSASDRAHNTRTYKSSVGAMRAADRWAQKHATESAK